MIRRTSTSKARSVLLPLLVLVVIALGIALENQGRRLDPPASTIPTPNQTTSGNRPETPAPALPSLRLPIAEFELRITKKPFGRYVSPTDSPVQPERFTGYHTGVDVEYEDVTSDVPVYAVAKGEIIYSGTVDGYGGVTLLRFTYQDKTYTALYGHLRPAQLPNVGQTLDAGEVLGVLGTGHTTETDGERRHLHFSLRPDNELELRGYVRQASELSDWNDPLDFLAEAS